MAKRELQQVEQQMRFHEILERVSEDARSTRREERRVGPFLTVSRQAGSGGAAIAQKIAAAVGWTVLDKELVDGLAERLKVAPGLLELMDETRSNWFQDTLLNLFNSRLVLQDSYVTMLGKVMLLAAYEGKVVFVGRGANLLLPSGFGLRVRIVGEREDRVQRTMKEEKLDEAAASRRVDELDESRDDFIRRHFRCDPNDSRYYDLVVNISRFGIDGSIELVLSALRQRGLVE
jgi:cytidylate kinase